MYDVIADMMSGIHRFDVYIGVTCMCEMNHPYARLTGYRLDASHHIIIWIRNPLRLPSYYHMDTESFALAIILSYGY